MARFKRRRRGAPGRKRKSFRRGRRSYGKIKNPYAKRIGIRL